MNAEEYRLAIEKKIRRAVAVVGAGKLRHEIQNGTDWSSRRDNFASCGKQATDVEYMEPGGEPLTVTCSGCNKA